jgi:hypothetical protein
MPNHARPLVILKDMGPCSFDRQTMSFADEPVEQAKSLMRGMDATRNLVRPLHAAVSDEMARHFRSVAQSLALARKNLAHALRRKAERDESRPDIGDLSIFND